MSCDLLCGGVQTVDAFIEGSQPKTITVGHDCLHVPRNGLPLPCERYWPERGICIAQNTQSAVLCCDPELSVSTRNNLSDDLAYRHTAGLRHLTNVEPRLPVGQVTDPRKISSNPKSASCILIERVNGIVGQGIVANHVLLLMYV